MSTPPPSPPSRQVRVVAGPSDPRSRRLPRPDGTNGWHLPAHVRDPGAVREGQLAQALAGADVLVAQTFLTHRAALVPYGESRRAREWTLAAVRVARQAAEAATERVERDGNGRRRILVAGALPSLDSARAAGEGRLGAADLDQRREHVTYLAEGGVDAILVEPLGSVAEARAATEAAAETGIDVWTCALLSGGGERLRSGEPLAAWHEAVAPAAPSTLLVSASRADAVVAGLGAVRAASELQLGVYAPPFAQSTEQWRTLAEEWLSAGAVFLGLSDAATPESITAMSAAVDEMRGKEEQARAANAAEWQAWIADAASRARGGAALALGGSASEHARLPDGFAWTRAPLAALPSLPEGRYRLVVVEATAEAGGGELLRPGLEPPLDRLALLLEEGGILLTLLPETSRALPFPLRLVEWSAFPAGGAAVIARRED